MPITKIMVPLDGSELAERALHIVRELALTTRARVLVVRVVEPPSLLTLGDRLEAEARVVREAEDYVSRIAEDLQAVDIQAETAIPYDSDVPGALLEQIRLKKPDLVVMSSHGRSGLGRWVYGSVAEALLARSPVPVIVVRAAGALRPFLPTVKPPRILVPLDGSEYGEAALPAAVELAKVFEGTLILARVVPVSQVAFVPETPIAMQMVLDEELKAAKEYLEQVAARVRGQDVKAATEIEVGPVVPELLEIARRVDADMIAISSHGRTGLSELVFGSVTLGLLRQAEVPILVVRPELIAAQQRVRQEPIEAGAKQFEALQVIELTAREAAVVESALKYFADVYPAGDPIRAEVKRIYEKLSRKEAAV